MSFTVSVFRKASIPGPTLSRHMLVNSIDFHAELITMGVGEPDAAGRREIITYGPHEVEEVWVKVDGHE